MPLHNLKINYTCYIVYCYIFPTCATDTTFFKPNENNYSVWITGLSRQCFGYVYYQGLKIRDPRIICSYLRSIFVSDQIPFKIDISTENSKFIVPFKHLSQICTPTFLDWRYSWSDGKIVYLPETKRKLLIKTLTFDKNYLLLHIYYKYAEVQIYVSELQWNDNMPYHIVSFALAFNLKIYYSQLVVVVW